MREKREERASLPEGEPFFFSASKFLPYFRFSHCLTGFHLTLEFPRVKQTAICEGQLKAVTKLSQEVLRPECREDSTARLFGDYTTVMNIVNVAILKEKRITGCWKNKKKHTCYCSSQK
jgi:hypothetical protein